VDAESSRCFEEIDGVQIQTHQEPLLRPPELLMVDPIRIHRTALEELAAGVDVFG
jgi:hypothetical protein